MTAFSSLLVYPPVAPWIWDLGIFSSHPPDFLHETLFPHGTKQGGYGTTLLYWRSVAVAVRISPHRHDTMRCYLLRCSGCSDLQPSAPGAPFPDRLGLGLAPFARQLELGKRMGTYWTLFNMRYLWRGGVLAQRHLAVWSAKCTVITCVIDLICLWNCSEPEIDRTVDDRAVEGDESDVSMVQGESLQPRPAMKAIR